ncbi:MAG: hypothetical protein CME62_07585 [Halobacteriovoraceae bacterium]|nr:hypothetical protein [Halobacteriovoraceae bacterium]
MLILVFITLSCGKQIGESTKDGREGQRPTQSDSEILADFKKSQRLICDGQDCPAGLAKLVIVNKGKVSHCTGALISKNRVLTSASCFPNSLKIPGLKCSQNIFAVFSGDKNQDEIISCERILHADNNVFSGFPPLWKSDAIILKLAQDVERPVLPLNIEGVDKTVSDVWKVELKSDKIAYVAKSECEILGRSYLNPFSDHPYSSMFVVKGCELEEGSSGSILLHNGSILGIYSKEMSQNIYSYLRSADVMNARLDRYFHFFNVSCLKYTSDSEYYLPPKECYRENSFALLDLYRARMLKNAKVHGSNIEKTKNDLENLNYKYFKWEISFAEKKGGGVYEAKLLKPKCVSNIADWIDEYRVGRRSIKTYAKILVDLPRVYLKTKLNSSLVPISVKETPNSLPKTYEVEFNPFDAYVKGETDVTVNGEVYGDIFTNSINDIKKCK